MILLHPPSKVQYFFLKFGLSVLLTWKQAANIDYDFWITNGSKNFRDDIDVK